MDTKGNAYAVSDTSTLAVTRSDLTSQYTTFTNIFPTCKYTSRPVMSCHVTFFSIPFYVLYVILTHSILIYPILFYHSIASFDHLFFCSLLYSAAITSVRFQAVTSNVGGSNSGGHVIAVGLSGKYGYPVTVHSTQYLLLS